MSIKFSFTLILRKCRSRQLIVEFQTSKDAEEADVDINWELVFKGVVNSFGQLWCLDDDVVGSGFLVIIIGVMSPLTLACEGVGALFATLGAVAIAATIPGNPPKMCS